MKKLIKAILLAILITISLSVGSYFFIAYVEWELPEIGVGSRVLSTVYAIVGVLGASYVFYPPKGGHG